MEKLSKEERKKYLETLFKLDDDSLNWMYLNMYYARSQRNLDCDF